jgi:hypothetical protein
MEKTPSEQQASTSDINAEIDRELAFAKSRWGETFELKCLEGSRGDTLDDEALLRLLRYFSEHGAVCSRIIASTELPVNQSPFRPPNARPSRSN